VCLMELAGLPRGRLDWDPGGFCVTPSDQESKKTVTSVTRHGMHTVFTCMGIEADSYIEAQCAKAKTVMQGEF
jgi:hypothetical protein